MNKQQLKIDYIEQKNYYKIVYRKIKVRIYQIYFRMMDFIPADTGLTRVKEVMSVCRNVNAAARCSATMN